MRRGQFLSTARALVLSLALVGCGDGAVTESAGSVAPTGSVPGEGLRWPSEEYYAGWFDRDGEMVFRYFSDHADAAVAELEAHGHGGLPSRYSSAEWQQMREAIFGMELSPDEHLGTGYHGGDDLFEVLGQVDEGELARALDGHVYRFVPASGGRGH